jgi:endoglucanase
LDLQEGQQERAEWILESVKDRGFDWVRIPVQWGCRADVSGNIDGSFMSQVEETVGWAKKHGLVALINTHHEDWFDNGGDLNRLVNIWRQIAEHFQDFADSELVFEIFNEPNHMSLDALNAMNEAVLPVIRNSNPTRMVFLGGLAQMGRWWINQNPDALRIPEDANLGLTVHSYDPWSFAGDHPSSTSFSDDDAADAEAQQGRLADWAKEKGIQQVMLGEFGTTVQQPNRGDRLKYYKANAEACAKHDQGYAIWDDNGWWQVLNRDTRTWDEDILAQLTSPLTLV